MELRKFEGKRVRITDTLGQTYEGLVGDYIFPEDNYPEKVEGIILNRPIRGDGHVYNQAVEFTAPEIRSIEIVS